eukprot:scaffold351721_cov37-Prasinocladus_malaysianus.AAC.1
MYVHPPDFIRTALKETRWLLVSDAHLARYSGYICMPRVQSAGGYNATRPDARCHNSLAGSNMTLIAGFR